MKIKGIYEPRLEQLRHELKTLLEKEAFLQEQIENVRIDMETVQTEIKEELEVNYFI